MGENSLLLALSVSLSAGRGVLSKKAASDSGDRVQFFLSQTVLFLSGSILLFFFGFNNILSVVPVTVIYGLIYGILLVLSQWMFSAALKSGNTSVCTVIYSLGFILPTVSGALFWKEKFGIVDFSGVLIALAVIMLSVKKGDKASGNAFALPAVAAMLASGGLGIMQKLQQSSNAAEQKGMFLLVGFCVAFICSIVALFLCGKPKCGQGKGVIYPVFAGFCFAGANLLNTVLAGRLKSAVFFPLQNISTILLSSLLGVIVFRERFTVKTAFIIILGIAAVLVFSL